ncbi:hypothetical protein EMIHUDRAFT_557972 [Emiliania huxleyi CCMP1516]|uniref:RING-type E3 ubiquitin transferase n=2 Tax=Emiliania huxleyi TaxID=2903 RepID=A0A0D3IQG0_EMIH1|nr:hypothetical protein EMIHUDRAFT_557972 [Emiliania huxleyi CCMP1516]EOD13495.1 hypothetical protein EMIHUDRAFT_557972 [Emiliania huxleyi CCMP1516]|eukprot:XP_005765924.1 hypothetical protein EMIHUDRAFT_557972 [Emiliania huxleyi CCMP1516]
MGKKQHSKDQLYITQTEWKKDWGGAKSNKHIPYKVLPFDCCAISLRPFEGSPMCTADGVVFDLLNIVPYLKKYRRHPVTGGPLAASDLIKLNFHKNSEGKYHCPVMFKVFNQHTHIVAIRQTGNVFSHEAVKELNLKARSMRDLIDGTPFGKSDIITIQDPSDGSAREIGHFSHVVEGLDVDHKAGAGVRHNDATARILGKLSSTAAEAAAASAAAASTALTKATGKAPAEGAPSSSRLEPASKFAKPAAASAAPRWLQTTGEHSAGFTSTALTPVTSNAIAELSEAEASRQRYAFLKKKKYAQLQTSHGALNLELHADSVPMTCENFLGLAEKGYYDGLAFHRLLRNFMVQGGDPTGSGSGGVSLWGKPFRDEISNKLRHEGRGVVSMANSGPDSNGSQFFITFKSAAHLDGKHTVFGRVVGGFDALTRIEAVKTDKEDRPTQAVSISGVNVLVNPFDNLDAEMAEAHEREADPAAAAAEEKAKRAAEDAQAWYNGPVERPKQLREGVGKYIAAEHLRYGAPAAPPAEGQAAPPKKKLKGSGGFSDFSAW